MLVTAPLLNGIIMHEDWRRARADILLYSSSSLVVSVRVRPSLLRAWLVVLRDKLLRCVFQTTTILVTCGEECIMWDSGCVMCDGKFSAGKK